MRIRKRIPTTASLPLADPKLSKPSSFVVQVQPHVAQHDHPHVNLHSQPSDHPNQLPSDHHQAKKRELIIPDHTSQQDLESQIKDDERWGPDDNEDEMKNININHMRKECTMNAEVDIALLLSSSSSSDLDGRWGEGDKVIPLKKRKGISVERSVVIEEENMNIVNTKWKSKTNKKSLEQNGHGINNDETSVEDDTRDNYKKKSNKKKKKKRGNVIMEGSRCSRVNGRGWRCCQPTLVGYSLCEHHLGKGRLRSMSSVRNRVTSNSSYKTAPKRVDSESFVEAMLRLGGGKHQEKKALFNMDDNDEKSSVTTNKKKMKKIGTVKARSMSSLLGRTDNIASSV